MDLSASPFAPAGISSGTAGAVKPGTSIENFAESAASGAVSLFGEDGLDFYDLLDVINPLQHIPVVSTIYRRMTGDDLSIASRIAGGGLFGGVIGLGTAAFNALLEASTGKDIGEHVAAAIFDDAGGDSAPVMVAELPPDDAPWYVAGGVRFTAVPKQQTEPVNIARADLDSPESASPEEGSRGKAGTTASASQAALQDAAPARTENTPWYLAGTPHAAPSPVAPTVPAERKPDRSAAISVDDFPWLGTPSPRIDPMVVATLAGPEGPDESAAGSSPPSGRDVDFTEAMMSGLDKYWAAARQQPPPPGRISVIR